MSATVQTRVSVDHLAVGSPALGSELATSRPVSNARRALRRFFRQRLAVVGLIIAGFLIFVALLAPLLAPTTMEAADLMSANQFPSAAHPFGTDAIGRDELTRVIFGTRTSLIVGFTAVALSCSIG